MRVSTTDMKQQRSLSTNIPLVADHFTPTPINHELLIHMNQSRSMTSNSNNNNKSISMHNHKLVTSSSFIRTASKKRREFGKDKRHAASNATNTHLTAEDYAARAHQVEIDRVLSCSTNSALSRSRSMNSTYDSSRRHRYKYDMLIFDERSQMDQERLLHRPLTKVDQRPLISLTRFASLQK